MESSVRYQKNIKNLHLLNLINIQPAHTWWFDDIGIISFKNHPWPWWFPSWFTAIQLGKSTARPLPTICIDYLVFCWERRGKMRIRMDSDGGWWVLNQLQPWLWSQLMGYEVLSSLRLTLEGNVFLEMWSKCWLQLTVDFRGYEATTEWYCTFVHVYRFLIFIIHV